MNKFESVTKSLMWFMALLLVTFVAGCGGGSGGGAPILGLPGLVSVVVTPTTATIPVTGTQQFTATATYNDGSSRDVTTTSVWSTSGASAGFATIGAATGLATAGLAATPVGAPVIINATFGTLVAIPATLIVNAATSTKFEVQPIAASISVGGTQQFAAIETFSDGTTTDRTKDPLTVWTSVNVPPGGPAVATLSANGATGGLATGKVVGSSTIHAVYTPAGGVAHAATPANLTVTTATVVSINVTPAAPSIAVGGTQQFTATAINSDGSSSDVTAAATWSTNLDAHAAFGDLVCPASGCATGNHPRRHTGSHYCRFRR